MQEIAKLRLGDMEPRLAVPQRVVAVETHNPDRHRAGNYQVCLSARGLDVSPVQAAVLGALNRTANGGVTDRGVAEDDLGRDGCGLLVVGCECMPCAAGVGGLEGLAGEDHLQPARSADEGDLD